MQNKTHESHCYEFVFSFIIKSFDWSFFFGRFLAILLNGLGLYHQVWYASSMCCTPPSVACCAVSWCRRKFKNNNWLIGSKWRGATGCEIIIQLCVISLFSVLQFHFIWVSYQTAILIILLYWIVINRPWARWMTNNDKIGQSSKSQLKNSYYWKKRSPIFCYNNFVVQ